MTLRRGETNHLAPNELMNSRMPRASINDILRPLVALHDSPPSSGLLQNPVGGLRYRRFLEERRKAYAAFFGVADLILRIHTKSLEAEGQRQRLVARMSDLGGEVQTITDDPKLVAFLIRSIAAARETCLTAVRLDLGAPR